jgi:hypothetical protein
VIPIVAGVLVATLIARIPDRTWRWLVAVLLCGIVGWAWSVAIGEFAQHWVYALVDAAQALIACVAMRWLASRYGPALAKRWRSRAK